MPAKKDFATGRDFVDQYKVTSGKRFRLDRFDPDATGGLGNGVKPRAQQMLAQGIEWLAQEQEKLYAQDRWSLLLIFQAMDAAGKDGTIKHVTSGINPQGCQVFSFKQPSAEELDHDFLWRTNRCLPERGRIGIFNRSYYEEVLVVRVHPAFLEAQRLPPECVGKRLWDERLEDIVALERHLFRSGTIVLKFFLNVSRKEQKRRFLERLDTPEKHWKFSVADIAERAHWDSYMAAYEAAIKATAAPHAPWFVVPADNKWFTRLFVATAVVDAMRGLDLAYPKIGTAKKQELAAARVALLDEDE
jgi:PPK2 family polyphosphate:nucleotide phosphotransferase